MRKHVVVKDDLKLTVRELAIDDIKKVMDFYVSLPVSDRKYLRIDVTNRKVVKKRIMDAVNQKDIRIAALHGNKIIATGALEFSKDDWRKNLGEMRLIVAKEYQRKGVGSMMARELYDQAVKNGVKQMVVKMMKPQKNARNMVKKIGFREENVLPGYVMDQAGRPQDLMIMTCDMKDFWKELEHVYHESDWRRCR